MSVIIISFNTADLITRCIESVICNSEDIEHEIIIVDNNSVDNSVAIIKNKFNSIRLIENKRNLGFPKACNQAVTIAKGEYILFLNSDAVLLNNSIRIYHSYMLRNNKEGKIGAIGSVLLDQGYNEVHSYANFPSLVNFLKNLIIKPEKNLDSKSKFDNRDSFNVDYITGAGLFISTETFLTLGGFDENYFMYFDDSDLQYKMAKNNLERRIINGPRITHLQGQSYVSGSLLKRIHTTQSLFYYFKKNRNTIEYTILRLLFLISIPYLIYKHYRKKDIKNLIKVVIS